MCLLGSHHWGTDCLLCFSGCRAHILFPDLLLGTLTSLPHRLPLHHAAPSVHVLPLLVLEGKEVVTAESQCTERKGSLGGHEKDITSEGCGRGW